MSNKMSHLVAAAVVVAGASTALAADPLPLDSLSALQQAQYHYRRHEERSAANEVRKAVTWLEFAAGHAMPVTRRSLGTAANELTALAKDLDEGKVTEAARLDRSLARASQSLAEWHSYQARYSYGKSDTRYAAENLEAAAAHLEHVARSAHLQFGPDTVTLLEQVRTNGRIASERKVIDSNLLGIHLDEIDRAVKTVGDALERASR